MADKSQTSDAETASEPLTPAAWDMIQEALRGLRFGQVRLVVHEGAIVQVERTECRRISRHNDTS